MKFTETQLKGSFVIELDVFSDDRGWFARTFCKKEFAQIGHTDEWVQLNHSVTYKKGSIRGMHFQLPPYSEIKLVRCIAGIINDVIIDLRAGSPTFLQWVGIELSSTNRQMLYIPRGFAHGFQTLTNHCELIYHHSSFYTASAEEGIRFDDERINIKWKLPVTEISQRDKSHPLLDDTYTGLKL
ncbi:MAG: dTDP-4-dehydrorhamnose 3,5-epimerase [Bacteroidetes bacterium]|nr:dTDP-4-dehydrorhamnose 3,5-epimerase [Bacteroidota bacterium]